MKMLFYSSDDSEIGRVNQELVNAGIPCEVRKGPMVKGKALHPAHAELWIRNDKDCHRAFLLCVQLGVGFAKRAPRKYAFDSSDLDAPLEADSEEESHGAPPPTNGKSHRLVFAKRVGG